MYAHQSKSNNTSVPNNSTCYSSEKSPAVLLPLSFEKQCLMAMIQNFERRKSNVKNKIRDDGKSGSSVVVPKLTTDLDQLDMLISNTYQLNLRRPRRVKSKLETRLEKSKQSWQLQDKHLSRTTAAGQQPSRSLMMSLSNPGPGSGSGSGSGAQAGQVLRRSCSADGSHRDRTLNGARARISCDVSNLTLEVVGKGKLPSCNGDSGGSCSSRTTTPDQCSSIGSNSLNNNNTKPVILKSCLKPPLPHRPPVNRPQHQTETQQTSKVGRSRQILKELQRQVSTGQLQRPGFESRWRPTNLHIFCRKTGVFRNPSYWWGRGEMWKCLAQTDYTHSLKPSGPNTEVSSW